MRRILMVIAFSLLAAANARAQSEAQALVDRSTLAVQEMMSQGVSQDPRQALQNARAVMICPRVFRAGFIIGGEGGGCVLVARGAENTWSYPAFYSMGSGSVGFQIGIQDSQFIMMIMTDRGLRAVLDSQVKLGADVSVAVATVGGGVQGSTTAGLGADIIAFAATRGLYGGVSLSGSVMGALSDWNQAYYGQTYAAQAIVIAMQGANPGADPLREVLTRYGSASAPGLPPAQTDVTQPSPPMAAPPGAVQQQELPAPAPPRG
jgi:lipid-binding SYLF domain-containing protein